MRAVASVLTRANSSGECARTDPAQCTRTEQPSTKAQRAAASSRSPGTATVPGGRSAPGRRPSTRKGRSEERRVGKECGRRCRSRWSHHHEKHKHIESTTYDTKP